MRTEGAHYNERGVAGIRGRAALNLAMRLHAPEVKICPSCKGRKVDRHGFDCVTCVGEGEVDE